MAVTEIAVATPPAATRARTPGAIPVLAARRLALTVRSPRALIVPLVTPVLFALVIAPALANTIAEPGQRTTYTTFVALATAGLLVPLNCLFSGLGVITDREHGAMRELLVAPIRRSSILGGNMLAAIGTTALQLAVLIGVSAARGATFTAGRNVTWFVAGALLLSVVMYAIAEILASRVPSAEAYVGAVPAIGIVPYFLAGSLFPLTALPHWLAGAAKVLPTTHALPIRTDAGTWRHHCAAQHLGPRQRAGDGRALPSRALLLRGRHGPSCPPALRQAGHKLTVATPQAAG